MPSYGLNKGKGKKKKMRTSRVKDFLRGFLGALLFLVAYWLLFVGVVTNKETVTVSVTASSNHEMLKFWNWNGRGRNIFQLESKRLVYVSKRRVPNGPDPIHNRRTVKTRQPPSA